MSVPQFTGCNFEMNRLREAGRGCSCPTPLSGLSFPLAAGERLSGFNFSPPRALPGSGLDASAPRGRARSRPETRRSVARPVVEAVLPWASPPSENESRRRLHRAGEPCRRSTRCLIFVVLPAGLPACLPACPPSFLPACLPACPTQAGLRRCNGASIGRSVGRSGLVGSGRSGPLTSRLAGGLAGWSAAG
eukprot:SAG11_NODE_5344_length_1589_cov_1.253020_2_plen_191_part_00